MTTPPRNIVTLADATVVRVAPRAESGAESSDPLQGLPSLLEQAGVDMAQFEESAAGPWTNPDLAALIDARERRQFVLLCADASPFVVSLSYMALEVGYNTFVVCSDVGKADALALPRLQQAGAIVMGWEHFLNECASTADAGAAINAG